MFNKFRLFFGCVAVFSIGCSANEIPEKTDVVNPWGNYEEFIRLLSGHREVIVEKIAYPEVCEPLVDEFIQEKVKVIHPKLILSNNAKLIQYMNDNTVCTDFKIKNIEYVSGSQRPSFEVQGPYYLYEFSHNKLAYVGIMPSGAYSPFNIKTPNIIDFEDITMPYMELWDVNQCQVVGGSSAPTDRGDFGFGVVISPSLGLLSYKYDIYKYIGSSSKSSISLSITPVLQKERKNAYCAVSGVKNIKQGG